MVEPILGQRRRPFPATPDVACYYPATGHERALARLIRGLDDGEGILVLTGPPGTGKTLLGHLLADHLSDQVCVFLPHGCFACRADLLQAVLYDLSLPYADKGESEMRLALTDHVLGNYRAGKRTVLLIDEAHLLGQEAIEELRLLGNLEGRTGKAVQVVLMGQPALLEGLNNPVLAGFRQRVAVRTTLGPLDLQEAADYLLHHLRLAGLRAEEVLGDEPVELLARACHGLPRLLNAAGHACLSLTAEGGAEVVDVEVVLEALASLGLPGEEGPAEKSADVLDGEGAPLLAMEGQTEEEGCRLFRAPGPA